MKITIVLLYCIFLSCNGFSSGHPPSDILIWKGDTLQLLTKPLENHPESDSLTKKILIHLYEKDQILHPERYKEGGNGGGVLSSACLGEYKAEWHLIDNELFLVNIYSCIDETLSADLEKLFHNKVVNNKMKATWLHGELVVGMGERLNEYRYIFEKERVFTFVEGQLKKTQLYTNWVKKSTFETLDQPEEWIKYTYNNIAWKKLPKLGNKVLNVRIVFEVNQEGKAVRITETSAKCWHTKNGIWGRSAKSVKESRKIKALKDSYIQEATKIAYLVPQWDVVYQQGKINNGSEIIMFAKKLIRKYAR